MLTSLYLLFALGRSNTDPHPHHQGLQGLLPATHRPRQTWWYREKLRPPHLQQSEREVQAQQYLSPHQPSLFSSLTSDLLSFNHSLHARKVAKNPNVRVHNQAADTWIHCRDYAAESSFQHCRPEQYGSLSQPKASASARASRKAGASRTNVLDADLHFLIRLRIWNVMLCEGRHRASRRASKKRARPKQHATHLPSHASFACNALCWSAGSWLCDIQRHGALHLLYSPRIHQNALQQARSASHTLRWRSARNKYKVLYTLKVATCAVPFNPSRKPQATATQYGNNKACWSACIQQLRDPLETVNEGGAKERLDR